MDTNKTNGADRNYLMDLVFSILHDEADEYHAVESLASTYAKLKATPDDLGAIKASLTEQLRLQAGDIVADARLRQAKTDYLASKAPQWDFHHRCRLKHSGVAAIQMFETYIADPNEETLDLVGRSFQKFYRELSRAVGSIDTDCGRCLNDSLNQKMTEEETQKEAQEE